MNILKLPNMIYPMMHVDKTNEIVDVLNEELNLSYAEVNPALTSTAGVCNWVVTHNLGTQNVSCRVYKDDKEIITDTEATSDNVVTVKINSTSDIEAETYSVIVLANGGGARGGITAIDSNLSPTSMNPVQNRILYPSLSNFIPRDTIFTVKANGTGNFTTIQSALDFLEGKWSNGEVTISIDADTFTITTLLVLNQKFNIPCLLIKGVSKDTTIINKTISENPNEPVLVIKDQKNQIKISDMTLSTVCLNDSICLSIQGSNVYMSNIKMKNADLTFINNQLGSACELDEILDLENDTEKSTMYGIITSNVSKLITQTTTIINITNASSGLFAEMGGINGIFYCKVNTTDVATKYSPALNNHSSGTGFNLGVES